MRRTIHDYTPEAFGRVRQTLLHVATVLGDWMEHVTLIGGAVPSLLVPQKVLEDGIEHHPGTIDVDLGLELILLEDAGYASIADLLRGEAAERSIWVCGPASFIVLKARAVHLREKPKDAYHLHYVLVNWQGGILDIAMSLRDFMSDRDAQEAMEFLRSDYATMDSVGPARAAFFLYGAVSAETQDDIDTLRASAHAYVHRLIDEIG